MCRGRNDLDGPREKKKEGKRLIFSLLAIILLSQVGSGALGCEYLKNFALMGVATGGSTLTVTDDDIIEKVYIYICIYIYIYIYVCMHACMYICIYVCMYVRMYVFMSK